MRRYCSSCAAELLPAHRFCGSCGKAVGAASTPEPASPPSPRRGAGPRTMFFGAMQAPGRAKLILIKGEGMDGVSYVLSATEHVAGRLEGEILFPEDPLLSPRHANFYYRDGKLLVRDESSVNGVFVRMTANRTVPWGASFLVGEQLLRVESSAANGALAASDSTPQPEAEPTPEEDGTYFFSSPRRPSRLVLTQLLAGGHPGMIFRARDDKLTIGREGNDINFPDDPFISGRHATVQAVDGGVQIADLSSKNGTFLRIQEEQPLKHGDYVFIGQQLLRVEVT